MIPIPPWAYAAAAGLVFAAGFGAAWKVQGWRCESARAESLEEAAKQKEAAASKLNTASTIYEGQRSNDRAESVVAQTEIRTVYKDRVINADCALVPAARSVLQKRLDSANTAAGSEPRKPM